MKLEYVNFVSGDEVLGRKIIVDEKAKVRYSFAPIAEVPDELGKRILAQMPKEFRIVDEGAETPPAVPPVVEEFKCDLCDFKSKKRVGLIQHKRFKHKEIEK